MVHEFWWWGRGRWLVAGDDQRGSFVAARHELEARVRGAGTVVPQGGLPGEDVSEGPSSQACPVSPRPTSTYASPCNLIRAVPMLHVDKRVSFGHRAGRRPQYIAFLGAALGAVIVFTSLLFPYVGSGFGSSLSGFELADMATSGATGGLLPPLVGMGLYLILAVAAVLVAASGARASWARFIRVGAAVALAMLVLGALAMVPLGFGAAPGLGLLVGLAGVCLVAGSMTLEWRARRTAIPLERLPS